MKQLRALSKLNTHLIMINIITVGIEILQHK